MLKLADRHEVISFFGGWLSPSLFPVDDLKHLMGKALDELGRKVLAQSAQLSGEVNLGNKRNQWFPFPPVTHILSLSKGATVTPILLKY